MKTKFSNGKLIIELQLERPRLSSTGKTLVVATSRGPRRSVATVRNRRVWVVVTAFIRRTSKRPVRQKQRARRTRKRGLQS